MAQKKSHTVKQTKTPHFYTWHFKDWMISGARARLSWAARGIYQELLGLCYTERLLNDKQGLMLRLGVTAEYEQAMDAALAEFEIDKHGLLTHPRVKAETRRTGTRRKIASNAGKASAARRNTNTVPSPQAEPDVEDVGF